MKLILKLLTVFLVMGFIYVCVTHEVVAESRDEQISNRIKKAEQGDAMAQFYLGFKYYEGTKVAQDYKEAAKWLHMAAEQGLAKAQFYLGIMYYNGTGVTQDNKEAVKWLRKAAEQGLAQAQFYLGIIYELTRDYKEEANMYRIAAEQGVAEAQFYLGVMYDAGIGLLEDDIMAYALYNLSAAQGYEKAKNKRDILKKELSPQQIAEAQELSKQLLAKIKSSTNYKVSESQNTSQERNQSLEFPAVGIEGSGLTCFDGLDNDGDELVDCADDDCSNKKECKNK